MATSTQVGAWAEDVAQRHLDENGTELLDRNFSAAGGELDLVVLDGEVLVFVEVRQRRSSRFGSAAMSIGITKQRRIARAAEAWRRSHPGWGHLPCRFDVVALDGRPPNMTVNWIRQAFST